MLIRKLKEYLPASWKSDSTFMTIASHIQRSSICFSSVFHVGLDGTRLILKKEGCLFLQRDWYMFSMMWASCELLSITGKSLRDQKTVLLGDSCFGDPILIELYEHFRKQRKQRVAVLTQKMSTEDIQPHINSQLYELVQSPKGTLSNHLQTLNANYGSIFVDWGQTLFGKYLEEVKNGSPNLIDCLIVSFFYGELEQKYQGPKMDPSIDELFSRVWESKEEPVLDKDGWQIGSVVFAVYRPRLSK